LCAAVFLPYAFYVAGWGRHGVFIIRGVGSLQEWPFIRPENTSSTLDLDNTSERTRDLTFEAVFLQKRTASNFSIPSSTINSLHVRFYLQVIRLFLSMSYVSLNEVKLENYDFFWLCKISHKNVVYDLQSEYHCV
jgi:hypothetical protein